MPSFRIRRTASARIFAPSSSVWPGASRITIFAAFSHRPLSANQDRQRSRRKPQGEAQPPSDRRFGCHPACASRAMLEASKLRNGLQPRNCSARSMRPLSPAAGITSLYVSPELLIRPSRSTNYSRARSVPARRAPARCRVGRVKKHVLMASHSRPIFPIEDVWSLRYRGGCFASSGGVRRDPIPGLFNALISTGFVIANGH